MYEYTSAVFAVGLDGFAPVDNDRITAMAAEGWEPAHMAPVHSGFAAVVLFRREAGVAPAAPAPRARRTAVRTRKVPAPAPPATPARASRTAGAAGRAGRGAGAGATTGRAGRSGTTR